MKRPEPRKPFDSGKEIRAIARERVGRVPSRKVIQSDKDKLDVQDDSCPYCAVRGCDGLCMMDY